jgi:tetratricopeptide (TPR) repeat protein
LDERNIKTGRYLVKEGERDELAIELDKAEQLYNQGYYKEARNVLDSAPSLTPAGKLLYAWVVYHQGDFIEARKRFAAMAEFSAFTTDMNIGLGYCDIQENKPVTAMNIFSLVINTQANNDSALTGMGIALYRQAKPKEAAVYLEKALRINPSNAEAALILKQAQAQ